MGKPKAHGEAVADDGGECGLDKRTLMRPLFVLDNDGHKPDVTQSGVVKY